MTTKRTWQPKKIKRLKKHGFLTRMASSEGAKLINRRRSKGRKVLAVTISKK